MIKDLRLDATSRSVYSHPMNSEIDFNAVSAVKLKLQNSEERNVLWRTKKRNGIKSSVLCLQLSRDKYQTPLKPGSMAFHP